jgi:hypothetical protein
LAASCAKPNFAGARAFAAGASSKTRKARLKAKLAAGVLATNQFVIASFDAAGTNAECNEANNTVVFGPLP